MMLYRECRERGLVKAAQDEFFLARIGVDVADGKDSRHAGLKFFGVDLQRLSLEFQAPVGNGPQFWVQAKEGKHMIHRDLARLPIGSSHVEPGEFAGLLMDCDGVALEKSH